MIISIIIIILLKLMKYNVNVNKKIYNNSQQISRNNYISKLSVQYC